MRDERSDAPSDSEFRQVDRYLLGESDPCDGIGDTEPLDPESRVRLAALRAEFVEERQVAPPDVSQAWRQLAARVGAAEGTPWIQRNAIGGWQLAGRNARDGVGGPNVRGAMWRVQMLVAALAVVIAGFFVVRGVVTRVRSASHFFVNQYNTPVGQRATISLADGTTVVLAPGSTLRFAHDLMSGRRDVYLDGEAYFTVAHDPARPFVVFAGNTSTQVLGTSFGVRRYPNDRAAQVFVTEGRVAFSGAGVLSPGDVATMNGLGRVTVRHHADVDAYGAWTTGRLTFERERFGDVVPQLERWYGVTIRVTDSTLNDVPLTAVLRSQSVVSLVSILAPALEARIDVRGQVLTLSPR